MSLAASHVNPQYALFQADLPIKRRRPGHADSAAAAKNRLGRIGSHPTVIRRSYRADLPRFADSHADFFRASIFFRRVTVARKLPESGEELMMTALDPAFQKDALNLLAALVLGGVIGFERQWRQRLAGLRTNTLVSLGAAISSSSRANSPIRARRESRPRS